MADSDRICEKFRRDPTRNPRSGRPLRVNSQMYKQLIEECGLRDPKLIELDQAIDDADIERVFSIINVDQVIPESDLLTAFKRALANNRTKIAKILLENFDMNLIDENGDTPLILSVRHNNIELVEILIDGEADLNVQNKHGDTALIEATLEQNLAIIDMLIDAGANLNLQNVVDETALSAAVSLTSIKVNNELLASQQLILPVDTFSASYRTPRGPGDTRKSPDIVQMLLDAEADTEIPTSDEYTALLRAVSVSDPEIVQLLLDADANVRYVTSYKVSALSIVIKGHEPDDQQIARMLLEAGADVNLQDMDGNTALMKALEDYNRPIIEILLDYAASIKLRNNNGDTVFMTAAYYGEVEIMGLLVENNSTDDVREVMKMKNLDQYTALTLAILNPSNIDEKNEVVQMLLHYGVDPNVQISKHPKNHTTEKYNIQTEGIHGKDTVLILAVKQNLDQIVKMLLNSGANPNLTNSYGFSALIPAIFKHNYHIFERLVRANADINMRTLNGETPLIIAVEENDIDIVNLLLDRGADLDVQNKLGNTALILATRFNFVDIVKAILRYGPDLNIRNNQNNTALIISCLNLSPESLKLLIDAHTAAGDSVPDILNAPNREGDTMLILAAEKGSTEIVKILLEVEVDPNIQNNQQQNALMIATLSNKPAVVGELVAYDVDLDAQDLDGNTALMYAVNNRYMEMLELLVNAGADPSIKDNLGVTAMDSMRPFNQKIYELLILAQTISNARKFEKYKEVLHSMNLCDYSSLVPVKFGDSIYQLCLHEECKFYLKVFNLGNTERLNELSIEFETLQSTVGVELEKLKLKMGQTADMRKKGRIQRQIFEKGQKLQDVRRALHGMRGEFDRRKTQSDVLEHLECTQDGMTKGIIVVPQSWGYLRCVNSESYITGDDWGDVENKNPVQIFIYNSEINKHLGITCYNYDNLIKYVDEGVPLADWIRNKPDIPIEDGTGMFGGAGDIKIRKLPDGYHVLERSLNVLHKDHIHYAMLPVYEGMRIGHASGQLAVSGAHGQNAVEVYKLFKADEHGRLIHVPPVKSWAMNSNLTEEKVEVISVIE